MRKEVIQMTIIKKRKLFKTEAFKLVRILAESKIKFIKREDVEEGEVYAVVTPTADDPTVTFKDGDILVGPFADSEEAKAAVGDDVVLVSGDVDDAIIPVEDEVLEFDPVTKETIRSNLMRMRKTVIERVRSKVRHDIMREAEALGTDTDVENDDKVVDGGEAGATNLDKLATFVNAADTGSTSNDVEATQSADADNIDDNLIEANVNNLVNVYNKAGNKVDNGMIESIRGGSVYLFGSGAYAISKHRFQVIA